MKGPDGQPLIEFLATVPNTEEGAYQVGYYMCYSFGRGADTYNQSDLRGRQARKHWSGLEDGEMVNVSTASVSSGTGYSGGTSSMAFSAVHNADQYPLAPICAWHINTLLSIGEPVWVIFENGNVEYPIIIGQFGTRCSVGAFTLSGGSSSRYTGPGSGTVLVQILQLQEKHLKSL